MFHHVLFQFDSWQYIFMLSGKYDVSIDTKKISWLEAGILASGKCNSVRAGHQCHVSLIQLPLCEFSKYVLYKACSRL